MIAIVKIGGHQALVSEGEKLEVDLLADKVGAIVKLETLLVSEPDGSAFQIGTPILKNVVTEAKVISHGRSAKVRVFKMKPRKRYRRTAGHRQDFTVLEIVKIGAGSKSVEGKKEAPAAPAESKTATKKPVAKKSAPAKKIAKNVKKA